MEQLPRPWKVTNHELKKREQSITHPSTASTACTQTAQKALSVFRRRKAILLVATVRGGALGNSDAAEWDVFPP